MWPFFLIRGRTGSTLSQPSHFHLQWLNFMLGLFRATPSEGDLASTLPLTRILTSLGHILCHASGDASAIPPPCLLPSLRIVSTLPSTCLRHASAVFSCNAPAMPLTCLSHMPLPPASFIRLSYFASAPPPPAQRPLHPADRLTSRGALRPCLTANPWCWSTACAPILWPRAAGKRPPRTTGIPKSGGLAR